ncbi:MAG: DNA replication/repair protein RecF [Oscillospiraceae bacterium]|nr:DNA replication/repair protein RecF [Oscillospiraceae bacterium]
MNITSIKFKNYRNLKEQEINSNSGVNIIYGNNAQGKTNIIEAIWISTGGRSFRGTKDQDLINFNEKNAETELKFHARGREQRIKTQIADGQRKVFLNSILKTPASNIVGEFTSVIFSPSHLSLIKEGPHARRNFLDAAICQIKPIYAKIILQYRHILNQRNSLLKSIQNDKSLISTLDAWDNKFIDRSLVIRTERTKYLSLLQKEVLNIYRGLTSGTEQLELFYKGVAKDIDSLKEDLVKELNRNRTEDIARGFTGKGPHRDDLEIRMNNKSVRSFGSQGQQRSVVLAMKIAEAEILEKSTGEKPVILLDDVMSELDTSRRNYILNFVKNGQVFITCCEPLSSIQLANSSVFEVRQGKILP